MAEQKPVSQAEQKVDIFEVTLTAFVINNEGKFLILRRSPNKKRFPGQWTIPGGKLETTDFTDGPKDTEAYWYNVAEKVLKREIKEETGLDVDTSGMVYVTSLAAVFDDNNSFVQSFIVPYQGGDIKLQQEECVDHAWVDLAQARSYDLIDGIYDEMVMAVNKLEGKDSEWQRFSK